MNTTTTREASATAIQHAANKWQSAPVHVKAMAGAYVLPLIEAIRALSREIAEIKAKP